jgi:antitoxin (DNA-binding transcriptional repressor) of toxin-antitoxin stability system
MLTVSLAEAHARLPELIKGLAPGEELSILEGERTVAKLVGTDSTPLEPRRAGNAIGKLVILAEDDEHLKDFQEYMP